MAKKKKDTFKREGPLSLSLEHLIHVPVPSKSGTLCSTFFVVVVDIVHQQELSSIISIKSKISNRVNRLAEKT